MSDVLELLHYDQSPNFLRTDGDDFSEVIDYAHVIRRAVAGCNLKGVYVLRQGSRRDGEAVTPTVFVCDAATEEDAREIHRRVYNQNIVPFLIVQTPVGVRVMNSPAFRGRIQVPCGFLAPPRRLGTGEESGQ
ncbi:MAG TPA: hypothetical protein PLZ94_18155 [Armatimonadota bacterium]|nr:hypothetical protein [Armatimonadota bacterium]HPO74704.1 hypothetical protein [Armatimonadota bacterium]